jgi:tripartite-type tricarboxylate transporter receptor subunit TctC
MQREWHHRCRPALENRVNKLKAILVDLAAALTQRPAAATARASEPAPQELALDPSPDALQEFFFEQGWTDGLPVVPPTHAAVRAMLAKVKRAPDDTVGPIPPQMRLASIEKIAINAVMAGCRAEYFPVVLAALEAALDDDCRLYGIQTATNNGTPLVIVNGPAVRELELNARGNVFGQGSRANATIGRALQLILRNLGGDLPGDTDMSTQGLAFTASAGAAQQGAKTAGVKADAQSYPGRPIRLINPFPPGGGSDAVAHLVSQRLLARWDQSVVVDNRGGAGGAIGTEMAARAVPDGYTLLMATASTVVVNPLINKVSFDPLKDFDAVIHTSSVPLILVVHPSVPAKSIKEFIALAKSQPGKLNVSSSGDGTISHLAFELFRTTTGINAVHVPYRGGGPARNALLGAEVQANFANLLSAATHVKAGKLRALGVSTRKRASGMPDVPTLAEAGIPGYEVIQWNGILAPDGTPKEIIAKLNGEINKVIALPEIQKLLVASGAEPEGGTPEEFMAFIKADIAKWSKVVRDSKLKINQ